MLFFFNKKFTLLLRKEITFAHQKSFLVLGMKKFILLLFFSFSIALANSGQAQHTAQIQSSQKDVFAFQKKSQTTVFKAPIHTKGVQLELLFEENEEVTRLRKNKLFYASLFLPIVWLSLKLTFQFVEKTTRKIFANHRVAKYNRFLLLLFQVFLI